MVGFGFPVEGETKYVNEGNIVDFEINHKISAPGDVQVIHEINLKTDLCFWIQKWGVDVKSEECEITVDLYSNNVLIKNLVSEKRLLESVSGVSIINLGIILKSQNIFKADYYPWYSFFRLVYGRNYITAPLTMKYSIRGIVVESGIGTLKFGVSGSNTSDHELIMYDYI